MKPVGEIATVELFPELEARLVELLGGLSPGDWSRPTACPEWAVRDIAAHLLDTGLRRLSAHRDGHLPPPPDPPPADWRSLVDFLDRLNAEWVTACRRLSPRVLTQLIADAAPRLCEHFATLDPHAPALFPVAWAGDDRSPNWFDTAREYTERWHHQQQIRDAVGRQGLTGRRLMHPVLDAFVRALPHRWREVEAEPGNRVELEITGEAGGVWTLRRESGAGGDGEAGAEATEGWRLYRGRGEGPPEAALRTDQDTAWRLFTKGLDRHAAAARVDLRGAHRLGEPLLDTLAVMA